MAGLLNKEGLQRVARGRMGASMSRDGSRPNDERMRLGRDAARDLTEGTRAMNAGQEDEPNVTPEEQAQYQKFVENGADLIYSREGMPKLVEALQGDGSPIEGAAHTLATLVMRLEDSAAQAGQELPGDVMLHGGAEILKLLTEMSAEAGIHEFSEDEEEAAFYQALDIYRSTRQQQGRLPVDQLQGDMEQLMQAEQSGGIDQILPGITEYAQKAQRGQ